MKKKLFKKLNIIEPILCLSFCFSFIFSIGFSLSNVSWVSGGRLREWYLYEIL